MQWINILLQIGKSDDSSAGRIIDAEKTLGRFQNNSPWLLSKEQLKLAHQSETDKSTTLS